MRTFFVAISIVFLMYIYPSYGQLNLIQPKGGETFFTGDTMQIKWGFNDFDGDVRLSIYDGRHFTWTTIATVSNTGIYQWMIPEHMRGNKFRIKVETISDLPLSSFSRTFISLQNRPFEKQNQKEIYSSNLEQIPIYPNPTNEFITIKVKESTQVQIFTMLGVEVLNLSPTKVDGYRIDVSHLPTGVYYVRIGNYTQMFVKM